VKGAHLPVPKELGLNGQPGGASSGALGTPGHDDVDEVAGEGAMELGPEDTVHALPVRRGVRGGILKYMILERVLAEGEKKLLTPFGVAAGVDVEDDEDKAPDALHGDGLMEKQGALKIAATVAGQERGGGDGTVDVVVVVEGGGRSLALAGGAI
jgi:hypothetical protein